ncbi:hypothetical protein L2E82_24940 [Cichorium intybus]|uniref:Uncharacterized protein n=1 Tax=Cichorium intybus TaxID=13427 RepID=A0ACB9E1V0_CICIN|nr:hypothetical protein L2E82_24940 [Cichorium intybus]
MDDVYSNTQFSFSNNDSVEDMMRGLDSQSQMTFMILQSILYSRYDVFVRHKDLLNLFNNNGNPYSDVLWLAALVQSVGELEFGEQKSNETAVPTFSVAASPSSSGPATYLQG